MRDQTARDLIDQLRMDLHMQIDSIDTEIARLRTRYLWTTVNFDEFAALLDYLKLERKQIEKHVEIGPKQES